MTPEFLRELIRKGETISIEFKGEEKSQLKDQDIIETVVCMENRPKEEKGWVIIGVEDDGRITGARPRHGKKTDPARIQALIANRTIPPLTCRLFVIRIDTKDIIVIEVPRIDRPVATSDGKYLRRIIDGRGKPECRPFFYHEMQAKLADTGIQDYSALIIPEAQWSDLDPLEFERFRQAIHESRGIGDESLLHLPDEELAKALGAVEANHSVEAIRVLGLLLFGRESALRKYLPTHEVAFQVLSGTQVEVNEFYRWPLLRVMEKIMNHFDARYDEEECMMGLIRVGIPNYSRRAFREALANALIHRDYTRLGAVHVQWFDDRIEISNPGGFPEGVHLDNILVTPPRPRNPLLADAFKRAGIVERTGRGIDIIFYEQLRNGRLPPSYERSTETNVVVILPNGKANISFVKLIIEEERARHVLGIDELLILNRLWYERQLTTAECVRLLQKTEIETRAVLERLVESGLIEASGSKRTRVYHLSASMYRRMGKEDAYIRQKQMERLQMENLILDFVRNYGQITRKEVAKLCKVKSHQAHYLLAKMVREGKLKREGRGRATRYRLVENSRFL